MLEGKLQGDRAKAEVSGRVEPARWGQGRFPEALGWGCCYQPVPRAAERLQQESTRLTSSLGPGSSQGLSCWVSLSFSRFFGSSS